MSDVFFSIIMPVYNVEKYVKQSIESVLKQTFLGYELIIINDGSTDKTLEICKNYAEQYKNIRIIDQINAGVSNARNIGINKSIGKYLLFLDGDDWWLDSNMLSNIHSQLYCSDLDVDMYTFCYERYYETNRKMRIEHNNFNNPLINKKTINSQEFVHYVLSGKEFFNCFSYLYVYRAEIIRGKLYFDTNISIFEDAVFIFDLLKMNIKIMCTDNVYYAYRCERLGAASELNNKKMEQILNVANRIIEDVNLNDFYDDESKRLICNNLSHSFYLCLIFLHRKEIDKKRLRKNLRENIDMINYTTEGKDIFIRKMVKIFGIDIVGYLLYLRSLINKVGDLL